MKECKSPVNGVVAKNISLFEPGERARELGRLGGIRSGEVRRHRKALKEDIVYVLEQYIQFADGEQRSVQMGIILALIKTALAGNVEAFKTIRDTIDEKPVENLRISPKPDFSALDEAFEKFGIAIELPDDCKSDEDKPEPEE